MQYSSDKYPKIIHLSIGHIQYGTDYNGETPQVNHKLQSGCVRLSNVSFFTMSSPLMDLLAGTSATREQQNIPTEEREPFAQVREENSTKGMGENHVEVYSLLPLQVLDVSGWGAK